jgi:hypothetical protein
MAVFAEPELQSGDFPARQLTEKPAIVTVPVVPGRLPGFFHQLFEQHSFYRSSMRVLSGPVSVEVFDAEKHFATLSDCRSKAEENWRKAESGWLTPGGTGNDQVSDEWASRM